MAKTKPFTPTGLVTVKGPAKNPKKFLETPAKGKSKAIVDEEKLRRFQSKLKRRPSGNTAAARMN
jgi:hypothetical protein